jgi:hypothetical protein
MSTRGVVVVLGLLLASAALADADFGGSRKLLQWNNRNGYRGYDSTSAQLAANNRAIVNTQYAIRDAVESGANPAVTQGAAYYGNDQAWWAAQSRNYGPWGRYYGGKK